MTDKIKNKYAVVLEEYTAQYNGEKLEGWNQKSRKLLLFEDSEQAEEALVYYCEAQDSDYKVEVQKIGYVEVA
jgi:hypothetical protein